MNGKTRCEDITNEDLEGITSLFFFYNALSGGRVRDDLKSGDFASLTGLTTLRLDDNQLTTLPADIFSGVSALTILRLDNNQLSTLPSGVFAGLISLTTLDLSGNPLTSLPTGIFDDLPSATMPSLPSGVTINATVPTAVGTIADITDFVAMGSPRVVDVVDKFRDTGDILTFTAISGDTDIATVGVANDSEVKVTPLAIGGTATITVTATDRAGQTAEQTFTVTVNATPTTVGTIDDITDLVENGSPRVVNVATKFSDTDALTFSAMSNDINIAIVGLANDSEVTVTPVAVGTTSITVTATDTAGQTVEQTFSVSVTNPAPTATGTMDDITDLVENDSPRNVDVATNFSDLDTLTFTATSDNTAIATVAVMGSVVTITPVAVGTATITVTATDTAGQPVEQTFSVSVTNPAPTATGTMDDITDLMENGSPRDVNVASNFSDLDTLTFSATSDDTAIATVTVMDSIVTITPKAVGKATITVTATDIAGQTAEQTFTVTVTNPAPTATGTIADIIDLVENGSPRDVNVASNFSDLDTLTFSATSDDTAIATVTVMDSIVTITPKAVGKATITVTATDIAGQTAEQTFSVSVQADDVTTGTAGVKNIGISVSPNPIQAGDRVKITVASDGVYRLFGISGEFLTKGTLTKGDNAVALPSLAKGMYLLKIQTTHGRVTRKVVKK